MSSIAAVAVLALSGCSAPEPEPEELTVTAAGARYLDAVCPVNSVWDDVDLAVDRLRLVLSRGETGDTAELAAALGALAETSQEAANVLRDPAFAWPAAARAPIAAVGDTLESDADQATEVAEKDAQAAIDYRWDGAGDVAAAAAESRAALGLAESSAEACAER